MYCSETGSFQVNPIESLGFPCGRNPINSHLSCSFGSLKQLGNQNQSIQISRGRGLPFSMFSQKLSIILKNYSKLFSQKPPLHANSKWEVFVLKCRQRRSDFPDSHSHGKQQFIACCQDVVVHKECSNRWMNHTHTNKMGKWRCLIPVKLQVTRSHSPCVPSIVAFLIMTSHLVYMRIGI